MGHRGDSHSSRIVWFLVIAIIITFLDAVEASLIEEALVDLPSNALLSRHRRFALPLADGWVFKVEFTLKVPLDDPAGSTMSIELPFSYTVDTATTATGTDSYEHNNT